MREGGFRAAFLFGTAAPGESDAPRGHRVAAGDVRDLTHRKKDRDVRYEILRHSGDAGTSPALQGLASASRAKAHLTILVVPGGCAQCWNRTQAGKPVASLLGLPRSKPVFRKSMIRKRAHGSSRHSYGSPTPRFVLR